MVALPSYTDYRIRTKIIEDFATINQIKLSVSEYYGINGVLPTDNAHVGLDKPKQVKGVRLKKVRVTSSPVPGTIKVWYDNVYELPVLEKKNRINFVPSVVNGRIFWDCNGGNLLDKYRPPVCRGNVVYLDSDEDDD